MQEISIANAARLGKHDLKTSKMRVSILFPTPTSVFIRVPSSHTTLDVHVGASCNLYFERGLRNGLLVDWVREERKLSEKIGIRKGVENQEPRGQNWWQNRSVFEPRSLQVSVRPRGVLSAHLLPGHS